MKWSRPHVRWWATLIQLRPKQAQLEEISAFMSAGNLMPFDLLMCASFRIKQQLYETATFASCEATACAFFHLGGKTNDVCWSFKGMWFMPVIHWRAHRERSSCGFKERSS